ncbi:unnamed protein product [Musa acuminata subsp. burmannicoides]
MISPNHIPIKGLSSLDHPSVLRLLQEQTPTESGTSIVQNDEARVHISAINRTKWWFAKHFLHPDIVAEYKHIFLWDEDIGVANLHPGRLFVEMMVPVFTKAAWQCA